MHRQTLLAAEKFTIKESRVEMPQDGAARRAHSALASSSAPAPGPVGQVERIEPGLRRRLIATGIAILVMFGGIGGWIATANLSSAVVAGGVVVVDSNAKKVQHPSGGIVAAINVRNGDKVTAGDVVVRLDDTQVRANLGLVTTQLVQLVGRKVRLIAERDGTVELRFPPGFLASDPEAPAVMAGEVQLFHTRRAQRAGQKDQLRQRIGSLGKEIEGLTAQLDAKEKEIGLLSDELGRLKEMSRKQLVPMTRVVTSERELARLQGERGNFIAQIARAGSQISETELQISGIEQTVQSDAGKDLRDIEARINELIERRLAAEDQLKRIELRAPQSGIVHELAVHTVGGVINAGEPVMLVVPNEEALAIEVRISPNDIDQVSLGRRATLRFPSLNRQDTPELIGEVSRVAADLTREPQSGTMYFLARLKVTASEEAKLRAIRLVPGMPVEGHIEGGERTTWSYLIKPITDQFRRAFREE
jgi:HlyD family secretion protein